MKKSILIIMYFILTITLSAQTTLMLSHYLLHDFVEGVILMKDGTQIQIPLNYNSSSEQIVFIRNGQKLALGDETISQVETVFINNKNLFF